MAAKKKAHPSAFRDGTLTGLQSVLSWDVFDPKDRALINSIKYSVDTFSVGKALLQQGDPLVYVYFLLDGWAFYYDILEDGGRQILGFILPGELIGFYPGYSGVSPSNIEILTECTMGYVKYDDFTDLMNKHSDFAVRVSKMAIRESLICRDHAATIGRRSAIERLVRVFTELICRTSQGLYPARASNVFHIPLNQVHIADCLGLTAVHVNRKLRQLREQGVLSFSDGRLEILNWEAFEKIGGIGENSFQPWLYQ